MFWCLFCTTQWAVGNELCSAVRRLFTQLNRVILFLRVPPNELTFCHQLTPWYRWNTHRHIVHTQTHTHTSRFSHTNTHTHQCTHMHLYIHIYTKYMKHTCTQTCLHTCAHFCTPSNTCTPMSHTDARVKRATDAADDGWLLAVNYPLAFCNLPRNAG